MIDKSRDVLISIIKDIYESFTQSSIDIDTDKPIEVLSYIIKSSIRQKFLFIDLVDNINNDDSMFNKLFDKIIK